RRPFQLLDYRRHMFAHQIDVEHGAIDFRSSHWVLRRLGVQSAVSRGSMEDDAMPKRLIAALSWGGAALAILCVVAALAILYRSLCAGGPSTAASGLKAALVLAPRHVAEGRVEDGRGSLGHSASLRFPSPLIKPNVPISGIRLSDWLHHKAHGSRRYN